MGKVTIVLLFAVFLMSCGSSKGTEALQRLVNSTPDKSESSYKETEENKVLIIFYDPTIIKTEELKRSIEAYNAEVLYAYNNFNGVAIRLVNGTTIGNAITHFSSIKGVLSVTKNEKMQLME